MFLWLIHPKRFSLCRADWAPGSVAQFLVVELGRFCWRALDAGRVRGQSRPLPSGPAASAGWDAHVRECVGRQTSSQAQVGNPHGVSDSDEAHHHHQHHRHDGRQGQDAGCRRIGNIAAPCLVTSAKQTPGHGSSTSVVPPQEPWAVRAARQRMRPFQGCNGRWMGWILRLPTPKVR